jgi:phosphoadenylyl-sulfate reductase (thioredoxin)
MVILDLVLEAAPRTPVITIDTGRLPRETFEAIDAVERRFGILVERIGPDAAEAESMIEAHGRDLFRDGVAQRMLCCQIRKVRPLARRMSGVGAYFSGVRRGQSAERAAIEVFDRSVSPVRISPLAEWSADDVIAYASERGLPEHPLYAQGFGSIGCAPCTRAVLPGEEERAGRWWWEDDAAKECGLHFSPDGRAERLVDVMLRDVLESVSARAVSS